MFFSGKEKKFKMSMIPEKSDLFQSVDEFTILSPIGKGGYSTVYLTEHKKTKKRYALKCCDRIKKNRDRSEKAYTEIAVLQKLKHPHIITLKGWFEDENCVYLVLQYISGKDIAKHYKQTLPDRRELRKIMKQLISAVKYLNENNIVHRDIKLENILIDSKGNIKLTDFGLCGIKKDKYDMFDQRLGTIRYSAPELLKGEKYNDSVDIWGIGVCFFMLLTGKFPFDGSNKENISRRIIEKTLHYSKYDLDRSEIKLLRALLNKDPDQRVEIEEILNFSYF